MKRVHSSLSFLWESKIDITAAVSVFVWGTFLGLFCPSFALFFIVLSSDADVVKAAIEFFDVGRKYEVLNFLGICMSGLLVGLYAFISYRRVKAMEDTVENAEKGRLQERLKNAIEHLGDGAISVRLGGAYELFHLAQDTEEKNQRQSILDILCAHIRQTTSDKKYQGDHKPKPSEEIQSLLTLLFAQEHNVFEGLHINLKGSWLNGANLTWANLYRANISGAYLQRANLSEANLQEANLEFARLQRARLNKARMQEARFLSAHLHGAYLTTAKMQGAVLHFARLQRALLGQAYLNGADLSATKLQGADLSKAHIEGANLKNANMEGAFIGKAHFQAANFDGANLRGATCIERKNLTHFTKHIRNLINKENDFSEVSFAGGLTQEDLNSLVEGLSDDAAKELRAKLNSHVGKPVSRELLGKSGVITGSYNEKDAEKWIAEYKEAVSEVQDEGDS